LVRFYTAYNKNNFPPIGGELYPSELQFETAAEIPDSLSQQWEHVPSKLDDSCKLKNGKTFSVSTTDGLTAMGWHEGVPNSYFKIQISDVVVYHVG
jgi:hypothetical protein